MKHGVTLLECDVYLTKDEEVLVHHDRSLMRTTGIDKEPKDYIFE